YVLKATLEMTGLLAHSVIYRITATLKATGNLARSIVHQIHARLKLRGRMVHTKIARLIHFFGGPDILTLKMPPASLTLVPFERKAVEADLLNRQVPSSSFTEVAHEEIEDDITVPPYARIKGKYGV